MDSADSPSGTTVPGALVISLDFELHWGLSSAPLSNVRLRARLLRTRDVIPRLLSLFAQFGIAATWSIVGLLYARSAREIRAYSPHKRPGYTDPTLWTGTVQTGNGEHDDPFHFAPSLIDAIRRTARQEIATHTFSHYYCLEPGQTREDFAADLSAACEIARGSGDVVRSIVFPRNQDNAAYRSVLVEHGLTVYRGNPAGPWRATTTAGGQQPALRLARLFDSYAQWSSRSGVAWSDVVQPDGLANVRATGFLRPYHPRIALLEEFRYRRIASSLRRAAERGRIMHLWWHPHNFGQHPEENLAFVRRILAVFSRCAEEHGMLSLGMAETAALARRLSSGRQVTFTDTCA